MQDILWQPKALADFTDHIGYIAQRNEQSARVIAERIDQSIQLLATRPKIGRKGRVEGTHEFSIPKSHYIIAYALTENERTLNILRIIHSARKWGKGEFPS